MNQKILSSVIYALTAFTLWGRLEVFYGEPITHPLFVAMVHATSGGAILFVIAFVMSFFSVRLGVFCGLAAIILSVPFLFVEVGIFPWRHLIEDLGYNFWADTLAAIIMLIISSAYTLAQLRLWYRARAAR